jgi:hypothetical protein
MKSISVTIKGVTPLLQHRFGEQAEIDVQKSTRKMTVQTTETPREAASKVSYRLPSGEFYFPGAAISRLLRDAGSNHKLKNSRKSTKFLVPAAVLVPQDAIVITNGDGKTPAKDFEVDSRPVVIPATKGRVMRHRPRFDCWSATFTIEIDEDILPAEFIHQLLIEGGTKQGIGDFRPEKGGPFGRFQVTNWN